MYIEININKGSNIRVNKINVKKYKKRPKIG